VGTLEIPRHRASNRGNTNRNDQLIRIAELTEMAEKARRQIEYATYLSLLSFLGFQRGQDKICSYEQNTEEAAIKQLKCY